MSLDERFDEVFRRLDTPPTAHSTWYDKVFMRAAMKAAKLKPGDRVIAVANDRPVSVAIEPVADEPTAAHITAKFPGDPAYRCGQRGTICADPEAAGGAGKQGRTRWNVRVRWDHSNQEMLVEIDDIEALGLVEKIGELGV